MLPHSIVDSAHQIFIFIFFVLLAWKGFGVEVLIFVNYLFSSKSKNSNLHVVLHYWKLMNPHSIDSTFSLFLFKSLQKIERAITISHTPNNWTPNNSFRHCQSLQIVKEIFPIHISYSIQRRAAANAEIWTSHQESLLKSSGKEDRTPGTLHITLYNRSLRSSVAYLRRLKNLHDSDLYFFKSKHKHHSLLEWKYKTSTVLKFKISSVR